MRSIVNLDIQDANGRTALDLAAFKGHAECVESLIMQGATIIVHDSVSKRTPLHASGNLTIIFFLFLILPGCSFKCYHLFSHEAQGRNVPNSLTVGMGFHCSYVPSST